VASGSPGCIRRYRMSFPAACRGVCCANILMPVCSLPPGREKSGARWPCAQTTPTSIRDPRERPMHALTHFECAAIDTEGGPDRPLGKEIFTWSLRP